MKHFIILFIVFSNITSSQNSRIVYRKITPYHNTPTKNEYVKLAQQDIYNLRYELVFNSTTALYQEAKGLRKNENPVVQAFIRGMTDFQGNIVFNRKTELVIHNKEFAGNTFSIHKNKINWRLSQDTIKIKDIVCYKATATTTI